MFKIDLSKEAVDMINYPGALQQGSCVEGELSDG